MKRIGSALALAILFAATLPSEAGATCSGYIARTTGCPLPCGTCNPAGSGGQFYSCATGEPAGYFCVPTQSSCSGDCPFPTPECKGPGCKCDPMNKGDPVYLGRGYSLGRVTDGVVSTLQGPIEYTRTYTSSGATWLAGSLVQNTPRPFGSSPTNAGSLQWSNNFFSPVRLVILNNGGGWYAAVRDTAGSFTIFSGFCSWGIPCWGHEDTAYQRSTDRVLWGGDMSYNTFVVYRASGERLVYQGSFGTSDKFYLSRVEDARGKVLYTVSYATPVLFPACPTIAGTTPYISNVTTSDGTKLVFSYVGLTGPNGYECVVSEVRRTATNDDGGTTDPMVSYTYVSNQPGLIASATYASGAVESYQYLSNGFIQTRPDQAVIQHNYTLAGGTQYATSASGPGETFTVEYDGGWGTCLAGSDCCGSTPEIRLTSDTSAGRGDGVAGSPGFSRTIELLPINGDFEGLRPYREIDTCSVAGSCSAGHTRSEQTCSKTAQGAPKAFKDKRDNWEVYSQTYGTGQHGGGQYLELRSVSRGATDMNGTGALEERSYDYLYGTGDIQLRRDARRGSLLAANEDAGTRYAYSSTNRRTGSVRYGRTKLIDGTTTGIKYIGTFEFDCHAPAAGTCSSGQDPFGRVMEVQGPCYVTSLTSTYCDIGSTYPVTRYTYHPAHASAYHSNRLQKVSRFPDGVAGTELSTTYDAYDKNGKVTQMTDESSVVTTYTYLNDRLATVNVNSGTITEYAYEGDRLKSIKHPEGNYEVFCYRSGTAGGCTGGTLTAELQWRAKAADANGSTWSERVDYTYWPDGTVKRETYSWWNGTASEVRRIQVYAVDAHRRPTWAGWGRANTSDPAESHPAFRTVRSFDPADNPAGLGHPFNAAPAFCGAGTFDKKCVQMISDRANRLSELVEYPTTAASGDRTCVGHDGHGHTWKVITGLGSGDPACLGADGKINPALPSTMAQVYEFDDFGNLLSVTLPWTGASGGAVTRYEYDALGNVTKKKSPAFSGDYVESKYDRLGRLTGKVSVSGGTPTTLYELQYDTGQPDLTCPQVTNGRGRLVRRLDSYGSTWYQYDPFGRVTREIRVPAGTTTCNSSSPHTVYTYSSNGNLTSITYPHGRVVTYAYGTGADKDRVSSASATRYLSGGGTDTITLLSAVAWEPYGNLRGYQLHHPAGSVNTAVEYMLGDFAENEPAAGNECPSSPPATGTGTDLSGRLRALRVSTGTFTPGTSNGAIYKRTYSWTGDQAKRVDTCLLTGTARTETYGYDQLLRLTGANGSGAAGGPFSSRSYTYDSRSNRTATGLVEDGFTSTLTYGSGALKDRLTVVQGADELLKDSYTFDADGRVLTKSVGVSQAGTEVRQLVFAYGPDPDVATDTVFKSVMVDGAAYSYFFDALGRRRVKTYPTGLKDELFHDVDNHLLSDRGNKDIDDGSWLPQDDYIWLDGRPVAAVRGRFTGAGVREPDSTADCTRNGDFAACGFYFPITDHIGKPVLMLDSAAKVAGVGEYDPFGYPNRVVVQAGTKHPYLNNETGAVVADFTQAPGTSMTLRMRVVLDVQDLEKKVIETDNVWIEDGTSGSTLWGPSYGSKNGAIVTPWLAPTAGRLKVKFTSDSENCCDTGAEQCAPFLCSCYPDCPYGGVSVSHYEYRRHESTASWFWTPLGFPGQYYDGETDLFENWNRYYDPGVGRYLQPEPLAPVQPAMAAEPAYAYAGNNPINSADPTGLYMRWGECKNWAPALAAARKAAGCDGGQKSCKASDLPCDICPYLTEGSLPVAIILPPGRIGFSNRGATGPSYVLAGGVGVGFNELYCGNNKSYPEGIEILAQAMFHEALHVCKYLAGVDVPASNDAWSRPLFNLGADDAQDVTEKCFK